MLSSFSPPILAAVPDLSSMADNKISTIKLEVDLDCSCCVKKITETLEKYPEIQTQILYHEKKTVTISGPFDPEKLMKSIFCQERKPVCCRQCYEGQRGGPCWHGRAPHPRPAPSVFVYASKVTRPVCTPAPMPHHVVAGEKNQPG